ncbi:unnamed protein product, partial [Rotaria sp. Silwood1]
MIIITSDENLIRQVASNKNENAYIINLDNNMNNLNFFPELTRKDQVYKRTSDITDHNQSKPVKTRKKSIDLICTICGDRAIGYNYAVLSCASCKAFFIEMKKFKCLTNHGQCIIDYKISRKYYRCRLERCFAMGMRKDLLLTQEEIQQRKDSRT